MSDGLKVLVVDDEVPLTGVVGSYLEREGFAVSVAHTGHPSRPSDRKYFPAS